MNATFKVLVIGIAACLGTSMVSAERVSGDLHIANNCEEPIFIKLKSIPAKCFEIPPSDDDWNNVNGVRIGHDSLKSVHIIANSCDSATALEFLRLKTPDEERYGFNITVQGSHMIPSKPDPEKSACIDLKVD